MESEIGVGGLNDGFSGKGCICTRGTSQKTRSEGATRQDELNYFSPEPVIRPVRLLVLDTFTPQPLGVSRARLEGVSDRLCILSIMPPGHERNACSCGSGCLSRGATRSLGEMGEHCKSRWQNLTHFFGASRAGLGEAVAYFELVSAKVIAKNSST